MMTLLRRFLLPAFLLAAGFAAAQQPKQPAAPVSPEDKKFSEIILQIRQLAAQQKFQEALEKVNEAEALKPADANVYIARASVYTTMKDYDKARENFVKADSLKPGSFGTRHNLTELDFVQGKYETAADSFGAILQAFPTLPVQTRSLVQFKIVVCKIKLNRLAEAEGLVKTYAFPEESPPAYFAKAALAVSKGDNATANTWLEKAKTAFKPVDIVPYIDALMEVGWLSAPPADKTKK